MLAVQYEQIDTNKCATIQKTPYINQAHDLEQALVKYNKLFNRLLGVYPQQKNTLISYLACLQMGFCLASF